MTKFIILKKKTLFATILFVLVIFILIFCIYDVKNISAFLNVSKPNHSYSYDFNGDGLKDSLTISEINNYYEIKIETSNKYYILNCSNINFLTICPYYNLKVNILDLSRDNIPEIILSNYYDNICEYCIFKWNGTSFENIFYCNDNILGVLNSNNSRTPFLSKTNFLNSSDFSYYFIDNDAIKEVNNNSNNMFSLDEVEKFIDLIEYPYEPSELPDIFASNISSDELKLFWNLDKNNYEYKFQSAYFYDNDWNDSGLPTSVLWTLSFKKTNRNNINTPPKEFLIHITTNIDYLNRHKISSILL
ncbi:MAG: hypothetical protein MJ191_02430 [Clostridium sp.]|nr:hypothetical protein [Clostridium sp.]